MIEKTSNRYTGSGKYRLTTQYLSIYCYLFHKQNTIEQKPVMQRS